MAHRLKKWLASSWSIILVAKSFFSPPHLYRHLQKRGSYSLVLLRKVINGKVETLVIEEDYFPSTRKYGVPHRYWVGAVLDVDGDGVMEIVLHAMYYEGGWTSVYQVEGNKVKKVLVAGWGV